MSNLEILAQIVGAFGLGFLIVSYLQKNKKSFLLLQIVCNVFCAAQYALLDDFTTVIMCFVALFRTILFYYLNKKYDKIPLFALILNEVAIFVGGILTYNSPLSIVSTLNSAVFAYGVWQKNLKKTYLIGFGVATSWAVYNFMIGAYVGVIASMFEMSAALVGFYRLKQDKKGQKKHKRTKLLAKK